MRSRRCFPWSMVRSLPRATACAHPHQYRLARLPENGEKRSLNPWGMKLDDLCRTLKERDDEFENEKVMKQLRDYLKTLK